jgi:hypothetical protein
MTLEQVTRMKGLAYGIAGGLVAANCFIVARWVARKLRATAAAPGARNHD